MLQLRNETGAPATLMLLADATGVDTVYAVVKATFALGERVTLADEQIPITLADEHYGDPATTSIRRPSDVGLGKPGTDVLLVGSAWAPEGRPVWSMDVRVAVGPVAREARVHADRLWTETAGGVTLSWVEPFTRMPLVWERAFGGADETERGPTHDARNPVGAGLRAGNSTRAIAGLPAPNVEDPAALISSLRDAPDPVGFAPIAPSWEPRRSYAGTYDERWTQQRAPYLPTDFDARFFHVAPRELTTTTPLAGGEPVELRGVSPRGDLHFRLPDIGVRATYLRDGARDVRAATLETILLEPDAERFTMTWRASLRCDKQALKVREVAIDFVRSA